MELKHIAPCGMNCCDCLFANKEVYASARQFKDAIEKYAFDKFLNHFSKSDLTYFHDFKKMNEFMVMLNKIISMQCETVCMEARGCSIPQANEKLGGRVNEVHKCDVLVCIENKGFEGCWDCSNLENCNKKKLFEPTYGDVPVENCKLIKVKGKEAVKPRGNRYYRWQQ